MSMRPESLFAPKLTSIIKTSERSADVIDEHARGEQVEREIDAMIRRRHDARVIQEGERPAHEAWMESEKRHDARRREENRAAWRVPQGPGEAT